MKKFAFKLVAIISIISFTFTSCKKDDPIIDPGPGPNGLTFRQVIESGGVFDTPTEGTNPLGSIDSIYIQGNEEWTCTTETLSINAASGGSSGFPLFDVGSEVIYPGNMLQGNSLNSGNPNPIVIDRAGGTISTNILDGNLVSSFEVEEVKKSSVTDAINNIIANATGTLPANFNIKIESVQSREQFALALGVDVNSTFVDLESNLNYSSNTEKSSFLVSLNQSYYTMSFDLPTSIDDLFDSSETPENLADYVGEGNPATYISSVTYGRIFYMLIESSSSQQELEVAVNGAFSGVTTDVDASLDINYFNSVENVTYSVFAYGGDTGPTYGAIGVTNVNTLVDVLKQSSTLGSAKPLSYVVRSVENNQLVATQLATTYDVVDCEVTAVVGTIPAIEHWTGHPAFENFGKVTAAYAESPTKFILLNESGQWLRSTFNNGNGLLEGPFELNSDYPLNGIGAACKILGPEGDLILYLDPSGIQYTIYNQDTYAYTQPQPIEDYQFGMNHPFAANGASAVTYAFKNNNPLFRNIWFNNNGENYVWNSLGVIAPWGTVYDVHDDFGGGVLNGKIGNVGAAIGYTLGNINTGDHIYIMFSETEDQYVIYGDINGNGNEAIGPFNL